MKKKYITDTYLRDVDDYDIKIVKDEKLNCYTTVKYIKSTDKPYIEGHTGNNNCLLDVGYYIIEYLPLDKQYGVRVFLNEKKEIIQYYIDITKENSVENNIPYYYDLYLDIVIDLIPKKIISVWDEDELEEALKSKDIIKQEYDMAYRILNDLMIEINNGTNKYINNNHKEVIDKLI